MMASCTGPVTLLLRIQYPEKWLCAVIMPSLLFLRICVTVAMYWCMKRPIRRIWRNRPLAYGHSYAEQVAAFAALEAIPNLLLTHFSPRYQLNPQVKSSVELLRQEARRLYTAGSCFWQKIYTATAWIKRGNLHAETEK